MKTVLSLLLFLLSLGAIAQTPPAQPSTPAPPTNNYGWSERISFIFGAGPSMIAGKVFQDVSIDKSSNAVIIESADNLRTPVSLGIVFTPFVSDVRRKIQTSDKDSVIIYEHYPRGVAFGFFVNPFELSSINATQSSQIDLGLGIGYRTNSFSVLATADFFSLRQPKISFIESYRGKGLPYTVNNEIQTSINTNEDAVYRNKKFVAFGIKLAYTFDIAKSYYSASR